MYDLGYEPETRREAEEAAEQTEMLRGIRYWPEPMDRRSMPELMHLSRLFRQKEPERQGRIRQGEMQNMKVRNPAPGNIV